ncbi:hypothetical protein FQR65_LT00923 [Abscondita terminalis]|nr:hypothetical protein FQR65_LT00923 [Abscondita terminalis]
MNSLLSVVRQLAVLAVINFASIAILIILKFNEWDIAATVVTSTFSVAIIGAEVSKRGGYNLLLWFRCLLAAGIIIGGISGFFWFFHLIHKLGHYQGDLEDTLWTSVTIILTFIISIYLVVTCYKTSTYVLIKPQEGIDVDAMKPPSITEWAQQYIHKKQTKKVPEERVFQV